MVAEHPSLDLESIVFPGRSQGRLLMLHAYFDDSSRGGLVGYGGFLGHAEAWDGLDVAWR